MYIIYDSDHDLTNSASDAPLRINSCGINTTRRNGKPTGRGIWVRRPSGRLDYQLLYMLSGHAEYWIDEEWKTVGEGSVVLYRPNEPQSYRTDSRVAMLCRWIHFSGSEVPQLLEACGMRSGRLFFPGKCQAAENLLSAMSIEMQRREPLYLDVASAQFRQALALLGRRMLEGAQKEKSALRQRILPAIEYIGQHYFESVRVEDMARQCGLSRYHFLHAFRLCMGMSPYAYLIQTRMDRAKSLLQDEELSVQEVAYLCGYDDPLYFSRAFSRLYGLSPSRFQQQSAHRA